MERYMYMYTCNVRACNVRTCMYMYIRQSTCTYMYVYTHCGERRHIHFSTSFELVGL